MYRYTITNELCTNCTTKLCAKTSELGRPRCKWPEAAALVCLPVGNSIPRTENDREARTGFTTQNAHCKALRNELSRGHVEVPGVVETGNVFWKMCTLSSSFAQKLWDQ